MHLHAHSTPETAWPVSAKIETVERNPRLVTILYQASASVKTTKSAANERWRLAQRPAGCLHWKHKRCRLCQPAKHRFNQDILLFGNQNDRRSVPTEFACRENSDSAVVTLHPTSSSCFHMRPWGCHVEDTVSNANAPQPWDDSISRKMLLEHWAASRPKGTKVLGPLVDRGFHIIAEL